MNEKVKQALENLKNIKVGSMVLNDLFGEDLKVLENAFNHYEAHEKELIKEQNRLFDLCKKQENELNDLREFAKIVGGKFEHYFQHFIQADIDQYVLGGETYFTKGKDKEFDLVKKVVEKYGKE